MTDLVREIERLRHENRRLRRIRSVAAVIAVILFGLCAHQFALNWWAAKRLEETRAEAARSQQFAEQARQQLQSRADRALAEALVRDAIQRLPPQGENIRDQYESLLKQFDTAWQERGQTEPPQ